MRRSLAMGPGSSQYKVQADAGKSAPTSSTEGYRRSSQVVYYSFVTINCNLKIERRYWVVCTSASKTAGIGSASQKDGNYHNYCNNQPISLHFRKSTYFFSRQK
jgi:hypothetical protein